MKAIKPKKTKFSTLAEIVMKKIESSIEQKCLIQGGTMKVYSLEDSKYPAVEKTIKNIIEDVFNKKPSRVCKINYFDSNLYLCFKKAS